MSKLTIDECKQIISKGRKQLTAAEKRIAELESLVLYMKSEMPGCRYCHDCCMCDRDKCIFHDRMESLGLK